MKKICIVAGARPNFIKVAPVIRAIRNAQEAGNEISYQLVYTGKEDDPTLESSLFDDLGIQKPDALSRCRLSKHERTYRTGDGSV